MNYSLFHHLLLLLSLFHQNLSIDTDIHAANGKRVKALDIFAYALAFFKEQALKVTHAFLRNTPFSFAIHVASV